MAVKIPHTRQRENFVYWAYPDVTLAQAREQAAIARQKQEKTKPEPPHIIPL
ncbi:hypothetical protein HMPREF0476_0734 [Kingella kingae ATCC 23330]|uniref:Uncharacterized protein n=1 Tax=Kingella kingae ATCC 23330 TaxID=887327 RepID=F5S6A1_KINKI|nr:hypothetical protein HMPREF0476_0734 [Kingella kingae ATCC 23330]